MHEPIAATEEDWDLDPKLIDGDPWVEVLILEPESEGDDRPVVASMLLTSIEARYAAEQLVAAADEADALAEEDERSTEIAELARQFEDELHQRGTIDMLGIPGDVNDPRLERRRMIELAMQHVLERQVKP